MSLIRDMLTSYRTTSANQARTLAELNKLRQEVARIKSQSQFGPRR